MATPTTPLGSFSYVIDGKLAGSAYPPNLKTVKEEGFDAVLNMTDKDPEDLADSGIQYLSCNAPSDGLADKETLDKAVEFINSNIQQNKKVLVHCMRGQNRTGIALAAYLLSQKGPESNWSPDAAQQAWEQVNRTRPDPLAETHLALLKERAQSRGQN